MISMMRIESVASQPDRAGRHKVRFSDGAEMRLYRQTVEDFSLYAGLEMDRNEYENLIAAAGEMSAKMRAVRIVSASSVSKKDLEQRLIQKGEHPADAKNAVEWMSDLDLLDDRKTAEQIVHRCAAKGYGIHRAKQALYEKRIPKQYWDEALDGYPDQDDAILSFLRTRLDDTSDAKQVHKAIEALIRRGHNYSDIRRGLQALSLSEDFPEE